MDTNLSTFISLKAELLRKQAEVREAKKLRSREAFVPSKSKKFKKQCTEPTDQELSKKRIFEVEDSEILEKSKAVLQAKAKYYEQMTAAGGSLNSDDSCLVQFNRKKQENPQFPEVDDASSLSTKSNDSDPEEEADSSNKDPNAWVEYTDCFGRTRHCLRKDFDAIKKRDLELASNLPDRLDQTRPNWMIDVHNTSVERKPEESVICDDISTISKLDELRSNRGDNQTEVPEKDNVHYQDVFHNEARQHGVAYYSFSTDTQERESQLHDLQARREETIAEQAQRDAQRAERDKFIAERVKAAKDRQRARLGLPPLEEEETPPIKDEDDPPVHLSKEDRKRMKRERKLQKKMMKEEQAREEARKNHVRPWDKPKTGVPDCKDESVAIPTEEWMYKPERLPMSQNEWNEQMRAVRNPEFAPVNEKQTATDRSEYTSKERMVRTNFRYNPMPMRIETLPNTNDFCFVPFQTTKPQREFQRRNACSYDDQTNADSEQVHRGVAIPPPENLDEASKLQAQRNLESSVEAGLRFLRENCGRGQLPTKGNWVAKANY